MSDLRFKMNAPIKIYEDNQAAICLAKNPTNHRKTKHIDLKYHFIRDQIINGKIELQYCQSTEMLADIFTKPLPLEKLKNLRMMLGLTSV